MKKVILSAAVVVLGLSATSCKKDYVCQCTSGSYSFSYTYPKTTKSTAQSSCDSENTAFASAYSGGSCKLN